MPSTARPAAAVCTTLVRIRPEIGPRNFLHRRIRAAVHAGVAARDVQRRDLLKK